MQRVHHPVTNRWQTLRRHGQEALALVFYLSRSKLRKNRNEWNFLDLCKFSFCKDQIPFNVESLLPVTRSLESTDQATLYTAWTCPRNVLMNAPSEARHSRTDLSNEADAINLRAREISRNK